MDMANVDIGLLAIFTILTIVNVILNTVRTIVTVRGGMFWSSFIAAMAFGFYTVVIVWTICDLPIWMKATVTALANFVGTYFVKYVEMKVRKDRLWMVDVVIYEKNLKYATDYLNEHEIKFSEMPIANSGSHVFHIYSNSKEESSNIRDLLKTFNAKYVVVESKSL